MNYTKYENEIEQKLKKVYGGNFKAKINDEYSSLLIYFDNEKLKEKTNFSLKCGKINNTIDELNLGGYGCEYVKKIN
ncbi:MULTISPECIES: hypothetical protein [unclassified Clostridium]|uniref:hypothetical protein n=1 Tax=unclassified Clostridium TaxID=2614128 RepID=UPI00207AF1CA|nr:MULTISPECIES: hypothetical protein [unclassified Clostridium]